MAKSENQKFKLLYIIKMFQEETDEKHCLTVQDIIQRLEALGVKAERKSIYDDIETLQEAGYVITQQRSRSNKYALVGREMSDEDLRVIVNALASSHNVSTRRLKQLTTKLKGFTSVYHRSELEQNIYVPGRIEGVNNVFAHLDFLKVAIEAKVQLIFRYSVYALEKRDKLRRSKVAQQVSPVGVCFVAGKYYLVAYRTMERDYAHYDLSRMEDITLTDIPCDFGEEEVLSVSDYVARTFTRSGKDRVMLELDIDLLDEAVEHFGTTAELERKGKQTFTLITEVEVGPAFFGYLASLGGQAVITAPANVAKEYRKYLNAITKMY